MTTDTIVALAKEKLNNTRNTSPFVNSDLELVLEKVRPLVDEEKIDEKDLVFVNVNNYHFVRIFIINTKYIIFLSVGEKGLGNRVQHIISKDIKKIVASEKDLNIYFHGAHEPWQILVDDYKTAVNAQKLLTELREKKYR